MAFLPRIHRVTLAVLLLCTMWSLPAAAELLQYQVSYRGTFSLGEELAIADLAFRSDAPESVSDLREASIEASSLAYPLVESLYPIRYRVRSWSESDDGRLVGFETFERTGKRRHRLYLRDASDLGVARFDMEAGKGREEMAQLAAGIRPASVPPGRPLFDRLGLLQWVREQNLHVGAEYRIPVTDGRDRLVYRVRVESAQRLPLAGASFAAWKLRFDGTEARSDGPQRAAHRPVFIWLSQTPGHIPLRADSRHPLGLFRIELKTPPGPEQVALADITAPAGPGFSRPPVSGD